jgi:F-type H+-transporting ATPase subunit delta
VSRIAIRYSKALFETALEKKKLDLVLNDLNAIGAMAEEDLQFAQLLQNPLIQAVRKKKIITDIFEDRVDGLTLRFLSLVMQKKRSEFLTEMITNFAERIDEYNGVVNGELISAGEIAPDQTDEIRAKLESLTGKKIRLVSKTDPDLIGGFVVRLRDTVIDLSVEGQLEKLRNKLVFG